MGFSGREKPLREYLLFQGRVMYYTYILKSAVDGRNYYGSTGDLEARLNNHNSGKVRSTKNRRPLELIYKEEFEKKTEALKREKYFKSKSGYYWLKKSKII